MNTSFDTINDVSIDDIIIRIMEIEFAVKHSIFFNKNDLKTHSYLYSSDYFVVLAYKIFFLLFSTKCLTIKQNLKNRKFKMTVILEFLLGHVWTYKRLRAAFLKMVKQTKL